MKAIKRIKNKTELRKIIKNSVGSTRSLEYVEFYADGEWSIFSCSTRSEDAITRMKIAHIVAPDWISGKTLETADQAISRNFRTIERKLSRK